MIKGLLYAGNEDQGIYVYHADEDMTTDHLRFLPIRTDTLAADVEGLAIYYAADGQGYLIASSQGQDYFSVFERDGDNAFVRKFSVTGVSDTDGIDVLNMSLNTTFPMGIFACHNGNIDPCPVNLVKWEDIAGDNTPDLLIDTTFWNPREAMLTDIKQDYFEHEIAFSVYPNPFHLQTKICLDLPAASETKCVLYDVSGKMVDVIIDGNLQAGRHEFNLNINDSLNDNTIGIYYCHINVNGKVFTKKLMCF